MTGAQALRDRLVREVDASGFGAHGLHVLVDDDEAEHRWTADVREDVWSVAKAVVVLAAGIAHDEGAVDVDAPVAAYLPDVVPGDGVDRVTLRHLLSMSSGIDLPWTGTTPTDWPDLAREFLRRPSRGRVFQYSNASTYTAATVLAERVGDLVEYLGPRLFEPLGIADVVWDRCPLGRVVAGSGLPLRTTELARIGRLVRDRGQWSGRQLVSARWTDAMHDDWVDAGETPGYDRYALAGWGGPGSGWRLHGAHGQLVLVAGRGVVTITAHDHEGADAVAAFVVAALEAHAAGQHPC